MCLTYKSRRRTTQSRGRRPLFAIPVEREDDCPRYGRVAEPGNELVVAANNYAHCLLGLQRFGEAKLLMRKAMPVVRRVLGESHELSLKARWSYARALYEDDSATLEDLREAVTTLEETEQIARRVFGGVHPITTVIERALRKSRAALRARETPPPRPG